MLLEQSQQTYGDLKRIYPMAKSKDLQAAEINDLLLDLGNDLFVQGIPSVRVMILGGAYMLLTAESRRSTQDIDVFPLNYTDSSQPDQQTQKILKSIRSVAKKHQLKGDWFNDAAFGILGWMMPPIEQMTLWRTYGVLEIFMPPADFILATKLFGYRDKDFNDVQVLLAKLQISTREQAQALVDRYIDRKTQQEYYTFVTLDDLFEE
jgi:hypothetical protein